MILAFLPIPFLPSARCPPLPNFNHAFLLVGLPRKYLLQPFATGVASTNLELFNNLHFMLLLAAVSSRLSKTFHFPRVRKLHVALTSKAQEVLQQLSLITLYAMRHFSLLIVCFTPV